jgi:hypothetical protein
MWQGAWQMKSLDFGRSTLSSCVGAAMLAACGGSQAPIGTPGAMPQSSAIAARADRGRSWMAPNAKKKHLLYISDEGTNDVYVYSYPNGTLRGTLTGFTAPRGECVDKAGDVFITNFYSHNILEYAHGGTSPIATLSDPGYTPIDCAVDPTTGNLAVTNFESTGSSRGDVAIYKHAKGTPKAYEDTDIFYLLSCSYDNAGDLFADGTTSGGVFAFAELPSGDSSLKKITLNQGIGYPGGVQWDGKYVVVGDTFANVIYQFTIHARKGTEAGSTSLTGGSSIYQFWIQKPNVIGPNDGYSNVKFWDYPVGGSPTKTIAGLDIPIGATVSLVK